jgi:hypothetical protein
MEWISVKDKLPENGTRVFVYRPTTTSQSNMAYSILDSNILKYCDEGYFWMTLPKPPKDIYPCGEMDPLKLRGR